jgi:hypothetical protein
VRLIIDVPEPNEAVSQSCPVPRATKGTAWKESCLGDWAKLTGVYVIHHAGTIKYVGKTGSPSMSYGMRLRREFQETASSGKHIYPKLALLSVPPDIMVAFFSGKAIEQLVHAEGLTLNSFEKIELFEVALINAYRPEFQRHHISRLRTQLRRIGIREDVASAMLSAAKQNS